MKNFRFWTVLTSLWVIGLLYCPPTKAQTDACAECTITPGYISWVEANACQIIANVTASSSRCPVVRYEYNWGDGSSNTYTSGGNSHYYAGNGSYTICITEVRGNGTNECKFTYCVPVTVTNCTQGCRECGFQPGNIVLNNGQPCQVIAGVSASSSTCATTGYIYNWGDGTITTSTFGLQMHNYTANGTYTVCVTEIRGSGATECRWTYCGQITVSECSQGCKTCGFRPGYITWTAGQPCQIVAGVTASSATCPATSFITNWGDGTTTTSSGSLSAHFYTANGTYTVCITEVRGSGATECRYQYCTQVTVSNCAACQPDIHEPDNSLTQATFGGSGCSGSQWNDYCLSPGDQDFVSVLGGTYYFIVRGASPADTGPYAIRFFCTNDGKRCLEIETLPVSGSTTNTFVELYETATNTLVASDDDGGTGNFSLINYCIPSKMAEAVARTWQLYPSLAQAGDFIRYTLPDGMADVELALMDVNGRLVQTYVANTGEGKFRLPGDIAPGMYFVRPNVANLAALKLIVQ